MPCRTVTVTCGVDQVVFGLNADYEDEDIQQLDLQQPEVEDLDSDSGIVQASEESLVNRFVPGFNWAEFEKAGKVLKVTTTTTMMNKHNGGHGGEGQGVEAGGRVLVVAVAVIAIMQIL